MVLDVSYLHHQQENSCSCLTVIECDLPCQIIDNYLTGRSCAKLKRYAAHSIDLGLHKSPYHLSNMCRLESLSSRSGINLHSMIQPNWVRRLYLTFSKLLQWQWGCWVCRYICLSRPPTLNLYNEEVMKKHGGFFTIGQLVRSIKHIDNS